MIDRIVNPIEDALGDGVDWAIVAGVGLLIVAGILTLIYLIGRARAERRMRAYTDVPTAQPPSVVRTSAPLQPSAPAPVSGPPGQMMSPVAAEPVAAAVPAPPDPAPFIAGQPAPTGEQPGVAGRAEAVAELARLKAALFELPFNAGQGTVQANLADLAFATLRYYEHALVDGSESLPIGASDDSPTSMAGDIAAVAGYLDLEQRLGRVGTQTSPHLAATLLMGALASHALGRLLTGDDDLESSLELAAGMVGILVDGIGQVSGPPAMEA